jgi:type VI secretion system protein ImpC
MSESIQHRLDHVRPPRVQITYDVEIGGAHEIIELPFVLGVMSDLSGASVVPRPSLKNRKFIEMAGDTLSDVMKSIQPRVSILVPNKLSDESLDLSVDLTFLSMDDFEPLNIVDQVPSLKALYDARTRLNDLLAKLDVSEDLVKSLDGVIADKGKAKQADQIVKESKIVSDHTTEDYAKTLVNEFLAQVSKMDSVNKDSVALVNQRIQQIDELISLQLNEILHQPDFQRLEASWRGLYLLITNIDESSKIVIRLLNISKDEIRQDLEKAVEFDQSQLFKKVYEEEYGTFGGHPYSFLMGDFEFGPNSADVSLVNKISQVAAAAHAPFIAGAVPGFFGLKSFTELGNPRDLSAIFESTELGKWQSFRETEDSRYVVLTLPHFLVRLPYGGAQGQPVNGLKFEEDVDGADNSKFCWANASWVLALKIMTAAATYSWPAAIRGVEGGGLVEDLPYYTFKTTDGDVALKCPTEIAITDRREKELSDLGFIALCHCKNRDYAAFFGSQTTQKPKLYDTDEANANALLSSRLSYILSASRFAHYIKAMVRDKIGSFMSKGDIERFLHDWICQYVLLTDEGSDETKAKFPLREARVDVYEVPGKPGSYQAIVYMRPHFQLEELTASIRLVALLPKPAGK